MISEYLHRGLRLAIGEKLVQSLNENGTFHCLYYIMTSCPKYGLSTPSRRTDVYNGLLCCTKHSSRYYTRRIYLMHAIWSENSRN